MDGGYIRLHRKLLDSPIFASAGLLRVWIWCLAKASFKRRFLPVTVGRGQTTVKLLPGEFVFGRKSAARELSIPESTVHDRMKRLQELGCIDIKPDTHFSIVRVVNWGLYQADGDDARHPTDTQATGNRHPTDTNKNVSKGSKVAKVKSFDGAIDVSFLREEDRGEILRLLHRMADVVPWRSRDPEQAARNWNELAKVAIIRQCGDLSDDDVEQALDSVTIKQPGNPVAWFHKCLANKAAARGSDFNAMLAAVKLPAWLPAPKAT